MSSILRKALIFREFASDGELARKYSLVFRGRTENSGGKTETCLQSERVPVCSIRTEADYAYKGLKTMARALYQYTLIFYRPLSARHCAQDGIMKTTIPHVHKRLADNSHNALRQTEKPFPAHGKTKRTDRKDKQSVRVTLKTLIDSRQYVISNRFFLLFRKV